MTLSLSQSIKPFTLDERHLPLSTYHVFSISTEKNRKAATPIFHGMVKAIGTPFNEYSRVRTTGVQVAATFLPYSSFGVTDNGVDLVYHDRLREASDVEDNPR
jgi:hypothetical protein